jgi:hypothetical protein
MVLWRSGRMIELIRGAGARELAQPAQRDLYVARAELDVVGEVLEFALVPHLHGAEIPVAVLADAHAFGIVAVGAVRRGAGCPDPFLAALVTALLFGEPLAQRFEEFFETAHRLDLFLLLLGEVLFRQLLEPLERDFRSQ